MTLDLGASLELGLLEFGAFPVAGQNADKRSAAKQSFDCFAACFARTAGYQDLHKVSFHYVR